MSDHGPEARLPSAGLALEPPFDRRRAGVLLHPTSLPSFALGAALGPDASRFLDFLAQAGFSLWQMLPINPVDHSGSPYHSYSVYAGDPRLIAGTAGPGAEPLDDRRIDDRIEHLRLEFERGADATRRQGYEAFKAVNRYWLDDYARYRTLKRRHDGAPWWRWPEPLKRRSPAALDALDAGAGAEVEHYRFEQFEFFEQWRSFRRGAAERGILLCGDMPIFSAHDSAELWAHPEFYLLDDACQPTAVAGVPPDYFSATGQRWGNPLYDWGRMADTGFKWWIERVRTQLELFDCLRLDHFRGFSALWHIAATCPTAIEGEWRSVPGQRLFDAIHAEIGRMPFIAEDLGIITPDVERLRLDLGLPGMIVLQFAFDGGAHNPYLPHQHVSHALVCTGTHDNDTTASWFGSLPQATRARVLDYLGNPSEPMPLPLVRAALASVARLAVLPLQDLLGLGGRHRMNVPGTTGGNWSWRFGWDWLPGDLPARLRRMNELYGRCGTNPP